MATHESRLAKRYAALQARQARSPVSQSPHAAGDKDFNADVERELARQRALVQAMLSDYRGHDQPEPAASAPPERARQAPPAHMLQDAGSPGFHGAGARSRPSAQDYGALGAGQPEPVLPGAIPSPALARPSPGGAPGFSAGEPLRPEADAGRSPPARAAGRDDGGNLPWLAHRQEAGRQPVPAQPRMQPSSREERHEERHAVAANAPASAPAHSQAQRAAPSTSTNAESWQLQDQSAARRVAQRSYAQELKAQMEEAQARKQREVRDQQEYERMKLAEAGESQAGHAPARGHAGRARVMEPSAPLPWQRTDSTASQRVPDSQPVDGQRARQEPYDHSRAPASSPPPHAGGVAANLSAQEVSDRLAAGANFQRRGGLLVDPAEKERQAARERARREQAAALAAQVEERRRAKEAEKARQAAEEREELARLQREQDLLAQRAAAELKAEARGGHLPAGVSADAVEQRLQKMSGSKPPLHPARSPARAPAASASSPPRSAAALQPTAAAHMPWLPGSDSRASSRSQAPALQALPRASMPSSQPQAAFSHAPSPTFVAAPGEPERTAGPGAGSAMRDELLSMRAQQDAILLALKQQAQIMESLQRQLDTAQTAAETNKLKEAHAQLSASLQSQMQQVAAMSNAGMFPAGARLPHSASGADAGMPPQLMYYQQQQQRQQQQQYSSPQALAGSLPGFAVPSQAYPWWGGVLPGSAPAGSSGWAQHPPMHNAQGWAAGAGDAGQLSGWATVQPGELDRGLSTLPAHAQLADSAPLPAESAYVDVDESASPAAHRGGRHGYAADESVDFAEVGMARPPTAPGNGGDDLFEASLAGISDLVNMQRAAHPRTQLGAGAMQSPSSELPSTSTAQRAPEGPADASGPSASVRGDHVNELGALLRRQGDGSGKAEDERSTPGSESGSDCALSPKSVEHERPDSQGTTDSYMDMGDARGAQANAAHMHVVDEVVRAFGLSTVVEAASELEADDASRRDGTSTVTSARTALGHGQFSGPSTQGLPDTGARPHSASASAHSASSADQREPAAASDTGQLPSRPASQPVTGTPQHARLGPQRAAQLPVPASQPLGEQAAWSALELQADATAASELRERALAEQQCNEAASPHSSSSSSRSHAATPRSPEHAGSAQQAATDADSEAFVQAMLAKYAPEDSAAACDTEGSEASPPSVPGAAGADDDADAAAAWLERATSDDAAVADTLAAQPVPGSPASAATTPVQGSHPASPLTFSLRQQGPALSTSTSCSPTSTHRRAASLPLAADAMDEGADLNATFATEPPAAPAAEPVPPISARTDASSGSTAMLTPLPSGVATHPEVVRTASVLEQSNLRAQASAQRLQNVKADMRAIKADIRQWEAQFEEEHGRAPTRADKQAVKHKYKRYTRLRSEVDSAKSALSSDEQDVQEHAADMRAAIVLAQMQRPATAPQSATKASSPCAPEAARSPAAHSSASPSTATRSLPYAMAHAVGMEGSSPVSAAAAAATIRPALGRQHDEQPAPAASPGADSVASRRASLSGVFRQSLSPARTPAQSSAGSTLPRARREAADLHGLSSVVSPIPAVAASPEPARGSPAGVDHVRGSTLLDSEGPESPQLAMAMPAESWQARSLRSPEAQLATPTQASQGGLRQFRSGSPPTTESSVGARRRAANASVDQSALDSAIQAASRAAAVAAGLAESFAGGRATAAERRAAIERRRADRGQAQDGSSPQ